MVTEQRGSVAMAGVTGQIDLSGTGTGAEQQKALAALRAEHGGTYDIGVVTIRDSIGPLPLWVAIRLEGKADPLTGFTADALAAAIRDDEAWVWAQ